MKQNLLIRSLNSITGFKKDLKKTLAENEIDYINSSMELQEKQIEQFKTKLKFQKQEAKLSLFDKVLKVGFIQWCVVVLPLIASCITTPIGYGLFEKADTVTKEGILAIVLIGILIVLQIKTFFYLAKYNEIYLYFNKNNIWVTILSLLLVPCSVVGNYHTFIDIVESPVIALLMCLGLDIGIITGMKIINDKKSKNFSEPITEEMQDKFTIFHMLKSITFDRFKMKLANRYIENRSAYKNTLKKIENLNQISPKNSKDNNNLFKDMNQDFKDKQLLVQDMNQDFKDNDLKVQDINKKPKLVLRICKDKAKIFKDKNLSLKKVRDSLRTKPNWTALISRCSKTSLGFVGIVENCPKDFKDINQTFKDINQEQNISPKTFKDNDLKVQDNNQKSKDSNKKVQDSPKKLKDLKSPTKVSSKKVKDNVLTLKANKDTVDNETNMTLAEKIILIENTITAMEDNAVIYRKSFIEGFNLTIPEWKNKVLPKLKEKKLVYTKGSTTYKEKIPEQMNILSF